jgi:hypothetical protein
MKHPTGRRFLATCFAEERGVSESLLHYFLEKKRVVLYKKRGLVPEGTNPMVFLIGGYS